MPEPEVQLTEGYSIIKGLKNAAVKTVLPALGAAVIALLVDPQFVAALQEHIPLLGKSGLGAFVLMFIVNWAKNRDR